MGELGRQQYDAHMAEYKVLRGEIATYSQRIDRTIGIYLTALFGLLGFLLRPNSDFSFLTYVESIRASDTLVGVFLSLGILNCLLLVRIQSFYLAVLSMAQYTALRTKKSVGELVGTTVLSWDDPDAVPLKSYWLPVSAIAQSCFSLLAIAISIAILVVMHPAVLNSFLLTCLYVVLALLVVCDVAVFAAIAKGARFFHGPQTRKKDGMYFGGYNR